MAPGRCQVCLAIQRTDAINGRMPLIDLPPINLDHLEALTDDTGVFQHAKFSIANRREGYTTDDNARALVAVLKHYESLKKKSCLKLARTYLSFIFHMQKPNGKIHNFLGYDRTFLDQEDCHDSLGRVLWASGYTQNTSIPKDFRMVAKEIFDKGLVWALESDSPRTQAFAILGLYYYAQAFPQDKNPSLNLKILADRLCQAYERESTSNWHWFESYLTYANPRLSQALFQAYDLTNNQVYLNVAEESIGFLAKNDIKNGIFHPVGNQGWYQKDGEKALYDQQPIEASCMVEAASTAFHVTNHAKYLEMANTAFDWFMGKNSREVIVYCPATGGCYDGITPEGVNRNQGAEATLSFLLAQLEMKTLSNKNL